MSATGEDLDNDDMSLIRTLFRRGFTHEEIATKRSASVDDVKKVLALYKTNGQKAIKKKDLLEGSFWYYQHKMWVLDGADFPTYNTLAKKVKNEYPYYIKWLEKQYDDDDDEVTEETPWKQVQETYISVAASLANEAQDDNLERLLDKPGGKLVNVDDEERILNSVCAISLGKDTCDGTLVSINGNVGILTGTKLIKNKQSCEEVKVKFESFDDTFDATLKPESAFYHNENLDIIFVDCEFPDECEIAPITEFDVVSEVKENIVCNSVYFTNDDKVQVNCSIENVDSDELVLDKIFNAPGAPIFIAASLAGIVMDEDKRARSVGPIKEWLEKLLIKKVLIKELNLEPGDKVKAKWSDGFSYPATIMNKTKNGYKVWFEEYGDLDENKIEVKESDITVVERSSVVEKEKKRSIHFLESHGLEKYKDAFEKHGLLNLAALSTMLDENVLRDKLKEAGLSHGASLKVEAAVKKLKSNVYSFENEGNESFKIKEILNSPMEDDFEPDPNKGELNLNDQFRDNDKISIRTSLKKIVTNQITPEGVSPDKPIFYLKSTTQKRYFKITIVYLD